VDLYEQDFYLREANKTGVLLARTRFNEQIRPFIKGSKERLAFVDTEIERIVAECALEAGADLEYVNGHLRAIIADEVAVTKPQSTPLEFSPEEQKEGTPPPKWDPAKVNPEPNAVTDVMDHEPVLEDEARNADAQLDLNENTQKSSEFDPDTGYGEQRAVDEGKDPGPDFDDPSLGVDVERFKQELATMSTDELHELLNSGKLNVGAEEFVVQEIEVRGEDHDHNMYDRYPRNEPAWKDDKGRSLYEGSVVQATSVEEAGDLLDKATWKQCFSCENKLNPIEAQVSPVCSDCNAELTGKKKVVSQPSGYTQPTQAPSVQAPPTAPSQSPQQLVKCNICDQTFPADQMQQHMQDYANDPKHQQAAQTMQMAPGYQVARVAQDDPASATSPSTSLPDEPVKVDDDRNDPVDNFDEIVQDLADKAAAKQFSTPDKDIIQTIAEQNGVDPAEVQRHLVCVTTFGNYSASNGEVGDAIPNTEGLTEVDPTGDGGRIEAHEALVPVDLAVRRVAEQNRMSPEDIYATLRDSFGDDLSDKYHASVSGERRYFLPSNLVNTSEETQQQQPQQQQPAQQTSLPQY
jgi:hypothetical protein